MCPESKCYCAPWCDGEFCDQALAEKSGVPSASSLPPAAEPSSHGDVNRDHSEAPDAEGGSNDADGSSAPSHDDGHSAYYMCKYFGEQCGNVTVPDADNLFRNTNWTHHEGRLALA